MNSGPLLFLGVLLTLATSFWGLIIVPQLQIGLQQVRVTDAGGPYPLSRGGDALRGAQHYRAHGCMECHTQQVRPEEGGSDIARGWGQRRTVAQDYLHDSPVLLGNLRLGPDLTNIGARQTNRMWHLLHLYQPTSTSPGSLMPPYRFLFEKRARPVNAPASPDALTIDAGPDFEIVPRHEARELVAYLLSLRSEASLLEAPLPTVSTNEVPGEITDTNNVAGAVTNSAGTPSTNSPTTNPPPQGAAPTSPPVP